MTSRAKQGGYQNWQELRDHLIDAYNETPHPSTEQEIIDAYELHPDAITKAALALIDAPDIRSGWGVLKKRATTIAEAPSNPSRATGLDKERATSRAEQWIRAAGLHLDRPEEVLDELCGDGGQLRVYTQVDHTRTGPPDTFGQPTWQQTEPKGDIALTTRMLDLWADHRPTGMQIERDSLQRAEDWKEQQTLMAESLQHAKAILDEQQRKPLPDVDYSAAEEPDLELAPDDDIPF